NASGSVTSTPPAVLTVVVPPVIQTPPVSRSAYEGGTAAFTVTANSSVPMTYQWRQGTTAVGTDSPTLSINPVTANSAGNYDVIVSNQAGSVTSAPPALLTVVTPAAMQLELPPGQPPTGPRTVSWQALAGKSYTLQRRDNFAPDIWHDLGTTNVTVSGPVQMTDDTAGAANIRFYQLRTQ
ncbi:MAG TPA: immunoglobulin domain-containing protein, partial [Verrucomicrobiae bacterium]|nr:immunoglobulin domain-containing protein [Verrucomicrobiae bacterium]